MLWKLVENVKYEDIYEVMFKAIISNNYGVGDAFLCIYKFMLFWIRCIWS